MKSRHISTLVMVGMALTAVAMAAKATPTRKAPDKSIALLHAECAKGALADAGLT